MKTIENIASECRKARIRAGNTQQMIASLTGTSLSAISRFEKGERNNAEIFLVYLLLYPEILQSGHFVIVDIDEKEDSK